MNKNSTDMNAILIERCINKPTFEWIVIDFLNRLFRDTRDLKTFLENGFSNKHFWAIRRRYIPGTARILYNWLLNSLQIDKCDLRLKIPVIKNVGPMKCLHREGRTRYNISTIPFSEALKFPKHAWIWRMDHSIFNWDLGALGMNS